MDMNYWSAIVQQRVSRRRALAGSTGAGLGALLLAACGGGSSDGGSASKDKSGLLAPASDETAKAVPGGTFVTAGASTSGTLDAHFNNQTAAFREIYNIYSSPLKAGRSIGSMPSPSLITGDAFESWEISPDGLQISLKLRANHKFDARPPTNGRAMTIDDVKWSWDRSAANSGVMAEVLNAKGEAGPLLNLTTPDSRTAVIRMAFPYGGITELLSFWYLFILPRETEATARTDPRGSGPWQLVKHDPNGTGIEYKRNPDWYVKGQPYLDGMIKYSIPEYGTQQAQFEAGALWAMEPTSTTRQNEVLRVKKDHPEMILRQKATSYWSLPHHIHWVLSQREDSPLKDQRLRQAMSMLYDREGYNEAIYNVSEFQKAGMPFETVSDTHLATQGFYWIDPRDKAFGDAGKYFKFNMAEAKKLIAASGFNGEIIMNSRGNSPSGQFQISAEIMHGMFDAGGLKVKLNPVDPNTMWTRYKASGYQGYTGMFQNTMQAYNDDLNLVSKYTPSGRNRYSDTATPGITDRIIKMQQELDLKRRGELVKQIVKDLAPLMPDIPQDYDQRPYVLHWPWIRNYNTFATMGFDSEENTSARTSTVYWYDASKKK
jgi:peptide/nickel transport system substrate-binding protein